MEKTKNTYKKSGVNIALANNFVKHIARISKKNVKKNKKDTKARVDKHNIISYI